MPGDLPGGGRFLVSDRHGGDLRQAAPDAPGRRRSLVDLPWTTVRQVHGDRVVVVDHGPLAPGEEADALVTSLPGRAIAVLGADCALVGLASPEGILGVAHAGWRGLRAGVLEAAAGAMRSLGASRLTAVLGPCIHAECYEFGPTDLDVVAGRLGPGVRATTASGAPALDLPAGVRAALALADVDGVDDVGGCTACSARWFSHRARRDEGRHALVVWRDAP